MAHTHTFSKMLTILKTSKGYVTKDGFTTDVNSKEILVCRAGNLGGKYAPKKVRIEDFIKRFNISSDISVDDCEFLTYEESDENRVNLYKWY